MVELVSTGSLPCLTLLWLSAINKEMIGASAYLLWLKTGKGVTCQE